MGKRNELENHKHNRVVRMDKQDRYAVICKECKPINNDIKKQLERFKTTLNKGIKTCETKNKCESE